MVASTVFSTPGFAQRLPTNAPAPAITQPALTIAAPVDPTIAALRDAALKDDLAYAIIEGLTTEVGQRLAGTQAEKRARIWAVAKLKSLGFKNVHVETYQMPVWVRGDEAAEIVAPFAQKMRLTALGNSGATRHCRSKDIQDLR